MTAQPQVSPTRLDALLLRWEELREQGQAPSAEELAADAPDLIPELAGRIAALRAMDAMLASGPPNGDLTRAGLGRTPEDPLRPPGRGKAFSAVVRMVEARFHARGGLGEVLVARQDELGRRVAVKRIRPDKFHPVARRRFLQEAAITASLQHPGIVPIYALGQDDDGPFYMMPFVEGRTLDEAIRQFQDGAAGLEPGQRALEFRGLLQRLVAVCETIAYAHDRGVVHRDLKPSNIMLGPYGETLVMDWGLAKHCTSGNESDESEDAPTSPETAADHLTATGVVLGTPLYMSPEQASGGPIGPASDIFSLGVILRAILAGRATCEAANREGGRAIGPARARARLPRRRRAAGIPAALEAISSKAMAAAPGERYETSRALAADLTRWLAAETVTAYREPFPARLRRWVRRHPRLVTGVAAASMMAAVALVASTAMVGASNRRLERANKALDLALTEAETQRDHAKEVTAFLVSSFRKPDPAQDGKTVTVAEVLGRAAKELEDRPRIAPATRINIMDAVSRTYRGLGMVPESVEISDKALALCLGELGADHPDTLRAMNNLGESYFGAGQLDRAIALLEGALKARRVKLGADHPDTLISMSDLGLAWTDAGQPDRAIPLLEHALELQRANLGADHRDTLTTLDNLALALDAAGLSDRSIPLHEEVLKVARAKLGADHPDTLRSIGNLALALRDAGRHDHAILLLEGGLKATEAKLGTDHPDTLNCLNNLALVYQESGQPHRAIPLHERALVAQRSKLGADHPATLMTMSNLAIDYGDAGQFDRSLQLDEQVLEARRTKLGADHPDTLTSINNLAWDYHYAGRLGGAIRLYEQALQAGRVRQGSDHAATLGTLANLASAYRDAGQVERAITLHRQALAAQREKLGEDHPDTIKTRRDLALSLERAGSAPEAESLFRTVVAASGRRRPRNDEFYSGSLLVLGRCLILQRKYAEAEAILDECLEIKARTRPDDWTMANARSLQGEALVGLGSFARAEALLLAGQEGLTERRASIRLLDRDAILREALDRLVRLYEAWGKPAQAEAWRRRLPPAPPARPPGSFDPSEEATTK